MAEPASQVFALLEAAASQNPAVMTPATEQLVAWETQPGFYSLLYDIVSAREMRGETRLIAVLFFKNRVDRYWRKNVNGAISESEKQAIREKLLSALDEPTNHLASQEAVLIGKIARFDCPMEWPSLIPFLQNAIRDGQPSQQARGLLILYRVAKSLVSKRLVGGRKLFKQMASEVFEFIYEKWISVLDPALYGYSPQAEPQQIFDQLEHARLLLKLLRVMVVHGVSDHDEIPYVVDFFTKLVERHQLLLQLRENLDDAHLAKLSEVLDKHIVLAHKIYVDVQEKHPIPFSCLLRTVLPLNHSIIVNGREDGRRPKLERSIVHAMRLIIQIFGCNHYLPSRSHRLETASLALTDPNLQLPEKKKGAIAVVVEMFSEQVLLSLCQVILAKYLVLTNTDSQQWADAPEEYAFEEVGEAWKFSIRPCAEHLYVKILQQYRGALGAPLVENVHQILSQQPTDTNGLLQREAAYSALCAGSGLSGFAPTPTELHDFVDFDKLFVDTLVHELANKHDAYKVIRRRVCEVIGQWGPVKFDKQGNMGLRRVLFEVLANMLDRNEDLVVRITAMTTLDSIVDDFGFHAEDLLPHLNATMENLFKLLVDVEQCESKMKVLHMITELVERMGSSIQKFSATLAGYLPGLWATTGESPDYGMLRTSIVRSYVKLVEALGSENPDFYDFLCSVIMHSIDITQPQHEYLLEDGMDLWRKTLMFAPRPTTTLMNLFKYVPHLIDRADGSIKACLSIIQSYIILGGDYVLQEFGAQLIPSLNALIGEIPSSGAKILCKTYEIILYAHIEFGCTLLGEAVSMLIISLIQGGDGVGHGHAGLYAPYMAVINRLALIRPDLLSSLANQLSPSMGLDVLNSIFDLWIDKYDAVVEAGQRKLSILAMCECVASEGFDQYIHPRFVLVVNMMINGLFQLHLHGDEQLPVDFLVQFEADELSEAPVDGTTEASRQRNLNRLDAVCTHNLKSYVKNSIERLRARIGQAAFDGLISSVDASIMQQLNIFLIDN